KRQSSSGWISFVPRGCCSVQHIWQAGDMLQSEGPLPTVSAGPGPTVVPTSCTEVMYELAASAPGTATGAPLVRAPTPSPPTPAPPARSIVTELEHAAIAPNTATQTHAPVETQDLMTRPHLEENTEVAFAKGAAPTRTRGLNRRILVLAPCRDRA